VALTKANDYAVILLVYPTCKEYSKWLLLLNYEAAGIKLKEKE
jgi:hypothetical protein